jgi:hypothetical protein
MTTLGIDIGTAGPAVLEGTTGAEAAPIAVAGLNREAGQ